MRTKTLLLMANIEQKREFDLTRFKEISREIYSAINLIESISMDKNINNVRVENFIDTHKDWKIHNIYFDTATLKFYIDNSYDLNEKKIFDLAKSKADFLSNTFSFQLSNLV